jgi:hypothetical protein
MTCKGFEIRGLRNIVIIFALRGENDINRNASVVIIIFT